MKAKTIFISAKCSDMFSATLDDGRAYNGYVPDFFPGQHFGDYVELEIELASGKILNWKKPTEEDLKDFEK
jgi:hypothetical protein